MLQIAQPAVQRAVVMKRGRAAKVVALDQRDVQAAAGRVPRGEKPMDATADDEQIERVRRECVEIAEHGLGARTVCIIVRLRV